MERVDLQIERALQESGDAKRVADEAHKIASDTRDYLRELVEGQEESAREIAEKLGMPIFTKDQVAALNNMAADYTARQIVALARERRAAWWTSRAARAGAVLGLLSAFIAALSQLYFVFFGGAHPLHLLP